VHKFLYEKLVIKRFYEEMTVITLIYLNHKLKKNSD